MIVASGGTAATTRRVQVLHPGDVACADRGERLETLLGSCVAIVLTDPRRTIGAMCHIVHASRPVAGMPDTTAYADRALATLYENAGRDRMKRFLLLLEPIAILLIGSIIGLIMAAIMLAVTSMNSSIA